MVVYITRNGKVRPTHPFPKWETEDGNIITIAEMDSSHIRNCIEKIKHSKLLWRSRYLPLLEEELANRGIKPWLE